jgi:hypothetical protein
LGCCRRGAPSARNQSISRSGRVDLRGPAVDAAGEVEGCGEALGTEEGNGACATDAVMAVDDEGLGFPGSEFVEAVGDFAEGNQHGTGQGDELVFFDFTDVEQGNRFSGLDPGRKFAGGELHGGLV